MPLAPPHSSAIASSCPASRSLGRKPSAVSAAAPTALLLIVAACLLAASSLSPSSSSLGDFEAQADVGKVEKAGSCEFDPASATYRVTGSGDNMWKSADAFRFVYRKASGDLTLAARVAVGEGPNAHRKAGCMIRQSLDADAPYVDVMVHGDGLIALQYRTEKGGVTADTPSTVKAPAAVRLERRGDTFTLLVEDKQDKGEADPKAAGPDKPAAPDRPAKFKEAGSVKVALHDPVYAGLAVCSHDAASSVTAVFTGVTLTTGPKAGAGAERPGGDPRK